MAVVLNGYVYLFGGEAFDAESTFGDAELYHRESDRWEEWRPMPAPRHGLGAAVLDRRIHVIYGGQEMGWIPRKVRWVSEENGDGAGYDIASFAPDGRSRLIEVKTTNGWERTPFHITRNELAVADERRSEWCMFRLWNFSREPTAFELHPPLDVHVSLTATTFQASIH